MKWPFVRGTTLLRGLTNQAYYLLARMILQVESTFQVITLVKLVDILLMVQKSGDRQLRVGSLTH